MQTIIVNGIEYKFNCVYGEKRSFRMNIGANMQLQVFCNGKQLNKNEIGSYAMEKIIDHIQYLINKDKA